jgi:hypothetical protein
MADGGERERIATDMAVVKRVKELLAAGTTNISIMSAGERALEKGFRKTIARTREDIEVRGRFIVEQTTFTNIKAAAVEGHRLSDANGKPYYVYGESGKYRLSAEKPEAELRYIQITPGGNEWTWSYNASADRWTKSRLGMVTSEDTGSAEWDRVMQLAGVEPSGPVIVEEAGFDWAGFEKRIRFADWEEGSAIDMLWRSPEVQAAVDADTDKAVAIWNKYAPEDSQATIAD